MPQKSKKGKLKEDRCKICGGKGFLTGELTWIHGNQKQQRDHPFIPMREKLK